VGSSPGVGRWLAQNFSTWHIEMPDAPVGSVDALARWATLLDVAHDRDIEVRVTATCLRAVFASRLEDALPDPARTVSRMSAWRDGDDRDGVEDGALGGGK